MPAVPYRAEVRVRALRRIAAVLELFAVAVALLAAFGDLEARWLDAVIPVAVLVAAGAYAQLGRRLDRIERLDPEAERAASPRVRWGMLPLGALVVGLFVGSVALLLDLELTHLTVLMAILLGGVVGDDLRKLGSVGHYEREHGGTVYRVADGLAWAPA
jgi:hypothetical protein